MKTITILSRDFDIGTAIGLAILKAMDALRLTDAKWLKICWCTADYPEPHGLTPLKDRVSQ